MRITARKRTPHAKWRDLGHGPSKVKHVTPVVGLASNGGVMLGKPWYSILIPTSGEDFELQVTESEARTLFFELGVRLQDAGAVRVTTKGGRVQFR